MWDLPGPGIEPVCPALQVILNHCTTREVPLSFKLKAQSEKIKKLYLPIIGHAYHVSSLLEYKVPGTLSKGQGLNGAWHIAGLNT